MGRGMWMASLALCFPFTAVAIGQLGGPAPPIKDVKNVPPKDNVFTDAAWNKPIVIRSEEDAAKHFAKDGIDALKKQVDFKQQILLVFAWKGSAQDRLENAVAESFPEQVYFSLTPGKTRDLRPHVYVYAVRSNVKWSVKSAGDRNKGDKGQPEEPQKTKGAAQTKEDGLRGTDWHVPETLRSKLEHTRSLWNQCPGKTDRG